MADSLWGIMRDVFKTWRREIGVVTLFMACAFAGGWIRSLATFDVINCPLGNKNAIAIASWKDAFAIRIGWDNDDPWEELRWDERDDFGYNDPESTNYRFKQPIPDGAGCFVNWWLLGCGGGIGVTPLNQRSYCGMLFMIIPYWSIVIPLTLLSAYLLISRASQTAPKPPNDSALTDGP